MLSHTREQPDPMRIAVLRESAPNERRVGIVPETVGRLVKAGHEIASVRWNGESYYEVREEARPVALETDPLIATVVPRSRTHAPRGKEEDSDYDLD